MKKPNSHGTGGIYIRSLIYYLSFCMLILVTISIVLSGLIKQNTVNQINNTLSLMSEKVNTSFEMMINYLTEVSDIMSAKEDFSCEESYDELQNTLKSMPYFSIGLVSDDGTIYGTPGEVMDIKKHSFDTAAISSGGIYITEPYRSSVTGSNMITMFSPIYHNNTRRGHVFVTYYLETVQNLAYTNILSEHTTVLLMNPYSGNFVSCSASEQSPAGTWGNVRLIKNSISCLSGYNYDTWLQNMKLGSNDNIINYETDGISYAQAFMKIGGMNNWNIVIRIPISELSNTMQQFTIGVVVCAALLILATLLFGGSAYWREHKQNKALQTLSDIDPLTKVINRRAFQNRLEEMYSENNGFERSTFMFLDVDYFKSVNDNYGHDAGDQVLCAVASILTQVFSGTGIVARVGGDEFNVFIYKPLSVAEIDNLMANLRVKFKEIYLSNGLNLPISYSAGLSVYPNDAEGLKELIDNADKALYHVKQNGRNNHFWFHDLTEK